MLFNSWPFVVFLAIVLAVYPRLSLRGQNLFLLVSSYFFYSWWDWRFTGLLLLSTTLDYYFALAIHNSPNTRVRKRVMIFSIIVNLTILGFFKYFNFFVDSLGSLLSGLGLQPNLPLLRLALPVGISFYTFQSMSYTIDVYRGELMPTRKFVDFALCVSFFPHLVAGPILRASMVLPQVERPRIVSTEKIVSGLNLMLLGFFKKVVIADTMAPLVNDAFSGSGAHNSGFLLGGLYAFALQIYGDFSGYTDIARGVARLMGFELMENFNAPYLSRNITEFWRRWHISLSTWLRDYLYISRGGNRRCHARTYVNLFLTMLLGGLWHGASWTFVIWGGLHGIYLAIHKFVLGGKAVNLAWPRTIGGWLIDVLKIFAVFHLVCLSWVFFRAPDFASAVTYLTGIFSFDSMTSIPMAVMVAAALVVTLDLLQTWKRTHTWIPQLPLLARYAVVELLLLGIAAALIAQAGTLTPFIYFQF